MGALEKLQQLSNKIKEFADSPVAVGVDSSRLSELMRTLDVLFAKMKQGFADSSIESQAEIAKLADAIKDTLAKAFAVLQESGAGDVGGLAQEIEAAISALNQLKLSGLAQEFGDMKSVAVAYIDDIARGVKELDSIKLTTLSAELDGKLKDVARSAISEMDRIKSAMDFSAAGKKTSTATALELLEIGSAVHGLSEVITKFAAQLSELPNMINNTFGEIDLSHIGEQLVDIATGFDAIKAVVERFPDISGLFGEVDFSKSQQEIVGVAGAIFNLAENFQQSKIEANEFAAAFDTLRTSLQTLDSKKLAQNVAFLSDKFVQLATAISPLAQLFVLVDTAIQNVIESTAATRKAFSTFRECLDNAKTGLEAFEKLAGSTSNYLDKINTSMIDAKGVLSSFNDALGETTIAVSSFSDSLLVLAQNRDSIVDTINDTGTAFSNITPNIASAAANFNNILLPVSTMVQDKLFDSLTTGMGNFAKKVEDSENALEKLRDKMTKTADNAEKLLEKLQALTAQTWTINVEYVETKK